MKIKLTLLSAIVLTLMFLAACKKPTPTPDPPTPPTNGSRQDLTRDSIFLYAKEVYFWNTALPTYDAFSPRKYNTLTTDIANYNSELVGLAKAAVNPATGTGYEYLTTNGGDTKYSYIDDLTEKNPSAFVPEKNSAVDLSGNGNDMGIKLGAYGLGSTPDPNDFALFVTAVYQNSPADKAGMIRSNRITKINGTTIGVNFNAEISMINSAMNGTTLTLEGVKYVNGVAGATFSISLTKASYKSSPIFATNVFTAGTKKIGYLAYARFSTLSNSKPDFDAAFANFKASGVTDLIIDLRYNGGGSVATAEYLINQIAPSSLNGKIMYVEHYNALMQARGANILKNQPYTDANGKIVYQNGVMLTMANVDYSVAGNTANFAKSGPLDNITNVVFIVSGNTASASELVINALKPHINVKLIGTKTYGKPVGFFPITIENRYQVWYSMFQTKNSLGQGDYFDGMTPDDVDSYDDPFYNFGNAAENYISKAIVRLGGGVVVSSSTNKTMSIGEQKVSVQSLTPLKPIGDEGFVGMVETRHKLKQ